MNIIKEGKLKAPENSKNYIAIQCYVCGNMYEMKEKRYYCEQCGRYFSESEIRKNCGI